MAEPIVFLIPFFYLVGVLGLTGFLIRRKTPLPLNELVAFGTAVLLGLILCEFVPRSLNSEAGPLWVGLLILTGFALNGLTERVILPRITLLNRLLPDKSHSCRIHDSRHTHHHLLPTSAGCSVVGCFILCAFFDGMRFSSSLLMDTHAILITGFALLGHQLPESVTIIGIALASGLKSSLFLIVTLYALAMLGGSSLYLSLSFIEEYALPLACGLFFYVLCVHLMPLIFQTKKKVFFVSGLLFYGVLFLLNQGIHSH